MTGEIFDPEIHATDKDGNPSTNKDGSFRKKRRDAGGGRKSAPSAKPAGSGPAAARARYHKSVSDFLALPVAGLSLADPVLGYAAGEVAPMWTDALADMAVDNPRLAAALERAGNLGAVGGLITAALVTGVQFGHLMGKVPGHMATMLGCKTREEIETILKQRGAQLAERAEHARAEAPAPAPDAWAHPEAA